MVIKVVFMLFVFCCGIQFYFEIMEFCEQLEYLYGVGFGFDVYKCGDYQIVQFWMDIINDFFVGGDEQFLDCFFVFLGEVFICLVMEDGYFRKVYVYLECEIVCKQLEFVVNDKMCYVVE